MVGEPIVVSRGSPKAPGHGPRDHRENAPERGETSKQQFVDATFGRLGGTTERCVGEVRLQDPDDRLVVPVVEGDVGLDGLLAGRRAAVDRVRADGGQDPHGVTRGGALDLVVGERGDRRLGVLRIEHDRAVVRADPEPDHARVPVESRCQRRELLALRRSEARPDIAVGQHRLDAGVCDGLGP